MPEQPENQRAVPHPASNCCRQRKHLGMELLRSCRVSRHHGFGGFFCVCSNAIWVSRSSPTSDGRKRRTVLAFFRYRVDHDIWSAISLLNPIRRKP